MHVSIGVNEKYALLVTDIYIILRINLCKLTIGAKKEKTVKRESDTNTKDCVSEIVRSTISLFFLLIQA